MGIGILALACDQTPQYLPLKMTREGPPQLLNSNWHQIHAIKVEGVMQAGQRRIYVGDGLWV